MRVALVHHSLRRGGGMESYLIDLVRGFRAAGDTVDVWAARIDPALLAELGIEAHRISVGRLPGMVGLSAFAAAVPRRRLRDRYEAVYGLTRAPGAHVHICGGTHPGYVSAMARPPRIKDRIQIKLERETARDATRVVAHSRMLLGELRDGYGLPDDKLVLLYPPIDAARFRPASSAQRAAARSRFGIESSKCYALFPSTGHARKGLDLLLAALDRVPDPRLELLIAGRAAGGAPSSRVRQLGYVREMELLYAAVDFVVLPSRYEPFGLVLAEAVACGTPVIASPRTGCAEILRHDEAVVLEQLSVDALAVALQRFIESRPTPRGDFVERNGLTIAAHVSRLRELRRAWSKP